MPDPNHVNHGLGPIKWRGEEHYEFDDCSFDFTHRQNRVVYPYVDGAGHEHTGMDLQLPVSMFFLNSIRPDAFPDHWNAWWKILSDGKPGELEHPVAGIFDAVVTGGNVTITAQATAGLVARVTFERHVEDPEEVQDTFLVQVDLEQVAAAADAATSAVDISLPSQAPVVTLLDLAKLIDSAILTTGWAVEGLITQAKAFVGEMVQLCQIANDPLYYAAQDSLTALWGAFDDAAKALGNKARETGAIITKQATTLDAFARDRGMTLAEAMSLNPGALGAPGVPLGTMLLYYK